VKKRWQEAKGTVSYLVHRGRVEPKRRLPEVRLRWA
jgi:hypothetical protein